MYKKALCTCEVVILLIKNLLFFFTFSLPSASLDLKVPSNNGSGGRSGCDGDGDAVVEVGRPW